MDTHGIRAAFSLTSPNFQDGSPIPVRYSCKGENINPELLISGTPPETKSLALIMHDPDAPGGDYTHWLVWNIRPDTSRIAENSVPADSVQGLNSSGGSGYISPCPPSGTHHYVFELYALNAPVDLSGAADQNSLRAAIDVKIIGKARLTGLFSAY